MKTAVIIFKTDEITKHKAQSIAGKLGIPLSSLLNAYLHELVATGKVSFGTPKPMTKRTEAIIAKMEKEIAAGQTSGPFNTVEEAIEHLNSL
jgi:addiction module RelB/DinJ family antitoxin